MSSEDAARELARLVAEVDRKMSDPHDDDITAELRPPRVRDRAAQRTTEPAGPRSGEQQTVPMPAQSVPSHASSAGSSPAVTEPMTAQPSVDPAAAPVRTAESAATEPRGTRRHRVRRGVVRTIALLVLVGIGYYATTLAQVWWVGRSDDRDPVDAVVVMGAAQYDGTPSPQLQARLEHVLELWPEGIAPLVVVTGGNLPGDRFTEAQASAAYLVDRGIPESAVVMEDEGSSSYESLESVAAMLRERGLGRIVIVTDPYHALRSKLIAEEVGLVATVSPTPTTVVSGGQAVLRHVQEAGGVAIGRLIGFRRLADLVD